MMIAVKDMSSVQYSRLLASHGICVECFLPSPKCGVMSSLGGLVFGNLFPLVRRRRFMVTNRRLQNVQLRLPFAFAAPCYILIHLIDTAMSYRSMWLATDTDPKNFSKLNNPA